MVFKLSKLIEFYKIFLCMKRVVWFCLKFNLEDDNKCIENYVLGGIVYLF